MDRFSPNQVPTYHVEHLATFSTTTTTSSSSSSLSNSPQPPANAPTTTTSASQSHDNEQQQQQQQHVTPRMALQRLFKMEKTSGIWTQRMAIQLKGNHMWILDGETNDVVERFPVAFIQQPTSFNDQNHIYNNILIFTVQLPNENQGELHIFQCVSHDAINVVDDIYHWMRHYGIMVANHNNNHNTTEKSHNNHHHHHHHSPHHHHHHPHSHPSGPSSNVNVKEAVNAFNQIAAQREKKGASNDSIHHLPATGTTTTGAGSAATTSGTLIVQDLDSRSDSSSFAERESVPQQQQQRQEMSSPQSQSHQHHHHPHSNGNSHNHHHRTHEMNENYSNERYVSILNHCFDDIERFIIRLQHAAAALRELQIRNHKRGAKGSGDGLLAIRARGPCEEEFFEILSKFKLAFNLLAKLKGCIHDPNAPELVHFLFTPLAIIIEAARANEPPVDPSLVGIPYLSPDAIELLSNCCTSKEFDLWQSLGNNWIQSVKHVRMTSPFQPIFTDGWAPAITEPELLGIIVPTSTLMANEIDTDQEEIITSRSSSMPNNNNKSRSHSHPTSFDDSDYEDQQNNNGDNNPRIIAHHHQHHKHNSSTRKQMEWLSELQSRNATKIVRVLFPRTANNNKELTVTRGEILEILDDSRKWWKARNSRGQIAHVPHTIVGEIESNMLMMMPGAAINNHHHQIAGPSTSSTTSVGGHNHHHHHHQQHHGQSTSMMMTQDDWIRRERQGKKGEFRYF
ncbi:epidermal growth factor receptor kinase substrate 8-like protein 1 [Dermatophagoides farinae]|uniref:Epidermal growth factor receptor kinase substrate 8-like protein 1 n=1 Tax=Dermatophagoides farinae TaxID=6954 RepID=A0A9D4NXI9_DERFA|nr:epidermal growth factor receptor kinase substrate 8-like protein 1 [Dermatophagoides farinae]